jgi:hypothetical protein
MSGGVEAVTSYLRAAPEVAALAALRLQSDVGSGES